MKQEINTNLIQNNDWLRNIYSDLCKYGNVFERHYNNINDSKNNKKYESFLQRIMREPFFLDYIANKDERFKNINDLLSYLYDQIEEIYNKYGISNKQGLKSFINSDPNNDNYYVVSYDGINIDYLKVIPEFANFKSWILNNVKDFIVDWENRRNIKKEVIEEPKEKVKEEYEINKISIYDCKNFIDLDYFLSNNYKFIKYFIDNKKDKNVVSYDGFKEKMKEIYKQKDNFNDYLNYFKDIWNEYLKTLN